MAPRNLPGQNQRVSACLIGRRNRIARIPVTRFLKRNKLVPIPKRKLKHSLNGAGTASGKARDGGRGRPSVKAKNLQVEKRITQKSKSQADNISNSRNHAKEFASKLRGSKEYQDSLRTRKATPGRRPQPLHKYMNLRRFRGEQLRLPRVLDDHDSDDVSDDDSDDNLVDYCVYNADDDSDDDSLDDDNPNDDPDYALDDDQLYEHMAALLEQEEALEESSESPATMTREST